MQFPNIYNLILGALSVSVMIKVELMQISLLQVKRIFLYVDISKPAASDNPKVAYKIGNSRWKKVKEKRKTTKSKCGKLGLVRKYCVVYQHRVSSNPRSKSERKRREI